MKRIIEITNSIIESYIRNLSGGLGRKLRYFYYRKKLGACGKNVIIGIGVIIKTPLFVFLEDDVWLDDYVIVLAGKSIQGRKIGIKENDNFIQTIGELHISKGVHIAPHCVLQAHGGLSIGKNSGVASGAKIYSLSHHYRNLNDAKNPDSYFFTPMVKSDQQFLISSAVVIGEGCAIGLNSVLLPGTTIPNGTWIGSNTTIVNQKLEPNAIYSSASGKFIKNKFELR